MKEYQGEDKPFFLYLSYQAPHDPLQAWPEDIAKYKNKYQVGYGVIADERYLRQKRMGIIDENYPRPESAHREWRDLTPAERNREAKIMAVYAAMIDRMDQNIGRLLQFLKQQGRPGQYSDFFLLPITAVPQKLLRLAMVRSARSTAGFL